MAEIVSIVGSDNAGKTSLCETLRQEGFYVVGNEPGHLPAEYKVFGAFFESLDRSIFLKKYSLALQLDIFDVLIRAKFDAAKDLAKKTNRRFVFIDDDGSKWYAREVVRGTLTFENAKMRLFQLPYADRSLFLKGSFPLNPQKPLNVMEYRGQQDTFTAFQSKVERTIAQFKRQPSIELTLESRMREHMGSKNILEDLHTAVCQPQF